MIQQHVASKIHDQRTAYIRYGMLFQEHGGKYDGHCQRYCAVADHWVFLEAFAGHERDAYRHGIVYVDAWKDVRRRIDGIQILYHLREDIVICKGLRP